ncbi:MAG: hypothetical protein ACT4PZ_08470 [Panacagrimonas sp.]
MPRTEIVFTRPGASAGSGVKGTQPRVRITRAGNPVKYAESLFRSPKAQSIPLNSMEDWKSFFESWETLRQLVTQNLQHIENTAAKKEEWARTRADRYDTSSEGDDHLTTQGFAREAKNHARRALNLIEGHGDEEAVGFQVAHSAMKAVEQWGLMVLSLHEPAILAERNIHERRKSGGRFGAENQAKVKKQNRMKVEAALQEEFAKNRPQRGRAPRIARSLGMSVSTVRGHLQEIGNKTCRKIVRGTKG